MAQSFKAKSLGSMESSDDKGENFIVREMQQTYDGDGDDDDDGDGVDNDSSNEYSVIPTLDGSILVHNNEGMRKTSVTARMLSEQEPYVSNDGLIYTGQRTDRLFGLDLSSGQILHDSGNPYVAQQRPNSNSAHGTALANQ